MRWRSGSVRACCLAQTDLFGKPASTVPDHALAAPLGVGLELGLQGREFGERRIRIGRLLPAFVPLVPRCRAPDGRSWFASRTVEPLIAAMPATMAWMPSRLGRFGLRRFGLAAAIARPRSHCSAAPLVRQPPGRWCAGSLRRCLRRLPARLATANAGVRCAARTAGPPHFDQFRLCGCGAAALRLIASRSSAAADSVRPSDAGVTRRRNFGRG